MKPAKPSLTYADIQWFKSEFIPSLADEVEKRLEKKLDDVSTKLDTFIGEIKTSREEQTLHTGEHTKVETRLFRLEKNAHLPPIVD
jgi:hypothetical protein